MYVNRLIFILLLHSTVYAQTFTNTVTIQKDLRVQGETVLGGVSKLEDITMYADTIHIGNLDGTGTLLGISGTGKVTRVTGAGAGGVTGLNNYQVLFGNSTGTIGQSANLKWSDAFASDILYITGTSPTIDVREGIYASNLMPSFLSLTDNTGISFQATYDNIMFTDDDGGALSIYKTDNNLGASYSVYFPAAQGAANSYLKNDGSGNLTWAAGGGTVTSIATTSPIGGGTITTTGTLNLLASAANKYLYSTALNTWTEGSITSFGRSLIDDASGAGAIATLGIPVTVNQILYGNGTDISSIGDLTFDGLIFALGNGIDFHMARFEVDELGVIEKYSNTTATDGQLFVGETGSGTWLTGGITSSDITVGYSSPNITLAISGLDATKIADGSVTSTEFQYINTLSSNAQTQLDEKTARVGTNVALTAQNASIAATTAYTAPASDGWYVVNMNLVLTTAATSSSQIGFRVKYTSAADNVVKTSPNINDVTRSAANTTGTTVSYSFPIYVKASSNIQYETSYTSSGATAAVYAIYITVEKIN